MPKWKGTFMSGKSSYYFNSYVSQVKKEMWLIWPHCHFSLQEVQKTNLGSEKWTFKISVSSRKLLICGWIQNTPPAKKRKWSFSYKNVIQFYLIFASDCIYPISKQLSCSCNCFNELLQVKHSPTDMNVGHQPLRMNRKTLS